MSRGRVAELIQRIRDAAKLQEPHAKAAIELIRLSADAAKDSLVTAEGNDMLRLQGATRQFEKLHKDLTTDPPAIPAKETK